MKPIPLINALATGLGAGYSRVLPGTVGTLWGIPLAWAVSLVPGLALQGAAALLLCVLAIPLCGAAERQLGKGKDPSCIVADEYLTLPIVCLGLPFTSPVVVTGFLLHRLLDITKPPPIRQLQSIRGGTGIVLDDLLAALIALALNHLLFRLTGWGA